MTARPARWRPDLPPGGEPAERKPTLFVVAACECGEQVAEVRDRAGLSVRLDLGEDGKARRDPAGEWWAVKLSGQWRVVNLQLGEDPPASGVRYAGHRCAPRAEAVASVQLAAPPDEQLAEPGPATSGRRPAGRGRGLDGPVCPERARTPQSAPDGGPPYRRMCVRCGRVTARSDVELMPWCGGDFRVLPLEPWMRAAVRG